MKIDMVQIHRDSWGLYATVRFYDEEGKYHFETLRIEDEETPEEFERRMRDVIGEQTQLHNEFMDYFAEWDGSEGGS